VLKKSRKAEKMLNKCYYCVDNFDFSYSIDKLPPENLDNRHCHSTYEVLYVLDGTGRFMVEGTTFDINPGTLLLIKPFEYHYIDIDNDSSYERYVVHFSDEHLTADAATLFNSILNNVEGSGRFYSSTTLSPKVLPVFERFDTAESLPDNEKLIYIRTLLSELMIFLSLSNGEKIAINEGELGAKVIRYLNENITRDLSLDNIARRFFVSKYYLCRAFKKHNGVSVHVYINHKRVMYAKQLIEQGETASGAAYRVGFGDYSAFYRAYVKVLGKSPTA
jgi:AraC-like DNA-binding protein